MNIHQVYGRIGRLYRRRRMEFFQRRFKITCQTRVLDLGGTASNWQFVSVQPQITIVNLDREPPSLPPNMVWIQADATDLPFEDGEYDVCYSNSVIEHLYTEDNQRKLAAEIRRLAPRYYVQTPSKYFPLEPHYLTPFVHWVPRQIRARVVKHLTIWSWMTRPTYERCTELVDEIRLLSATEMQTFFPDAEIVKERVTGVTKSIIAVRT